MAPKKNHKRNHQPKGPYYFFMMEFKKKQEAAGHFFRGGVHEVQMKASPHWNSMTNEEKEPYQKMAQAHREYMRENGEKYTSQGIPLTMVEAEQKAKQAKADLIKNTISDMLDKAVANNELEKLEFYFISFAYFCVTSGGTYIPAEMGLVRYSLKDGVMDKLHMFIDPGKLPLGMAYDAKQHSESDHQLPIPPDAKGEKDNDEIILKMFSFLSQQEKMPPLFTETNDIRMVENILKGILNQGAMDENTLLVCPLSELFYQLKRATESFGMDIKTFPSVHIAQAIIQKDVYEYTKDISCDFHEEMGNGKYCPLSKCVRWAYIISDSCCLDLSIEMKPGRHLPMNADTALCNTTEICDTSSYISNQMDNCSFVSSSDLTHVTNPKMHKLPKSHYDAYDDKSKVFSHSRGLKASYDSDYSRHKIKDEYPALGDSMKYETMSTTSSSSRRDRESSSRSAWDRSSTRDYSPPSRSSYDSYDRRDRDRDSGRRDRDRDRDRDYYYGSSSSSRDYGRDYERDRDRDRYRGESSREYSRDYDRERDRDRKRSESSRSSSDYTRVKQERHSPDSDREETRSTTSRSSDVHRVGGYGRGALYAAPSSPVSRSPPGSSAFSSADFPELGAVRSAGRGMLSK